MNPSTLERFPMASSSSSEPGLPKEESASLLFAKSRPTPPVDHCDRAQSKGTTSAACIDVKHSKVMIVDDEPLNIKVARKYLSDAGFSHFVSTTDPVEAHALAVREHPDLLLLDIEMPEINGLDVLRIFHSDPRFEHLPVIFLTAVENLEIKYQALKLGAIDFLRKPVDPTELVPRVRNILTVKAYQDQLEHYTQTLEEEVSRQTAKLEESSLEIIHCLARASEYRDNETGHHIIRVGLYSGIIARAYGLEPSHAELIQQAAPLHDVGKIGIPDSILLKPGKLSPEEYELMQQHCAHGNKILKRMNGDEFASLSSHTSLGAKIMEGCQSPVLQLATKISLTHHEKWDGSGYPLGLAGEDIPIEGRIVAVADVFDALSSKRPYKPAFPLEKCFAILEDGREKHFDADVLDAFFACRDEIVQVQIEYADID